MRISDWSSDVCSSDLYRIRVPYQADIQRGRLFDCAGAIDKNFKIPCIGRLPVIFKRGTAGSHGPILYVLQLVFKIVRGRVDTECVRFRSEEHTSELQSLMRIQYDVF